MHGELYQGVPRILDPDPPNAFGLFFMSALVLFATTGLERFVTAWYLTGRTRPVHEILAGIEGKPELSPSAGACDALSSRAEREGSLASVSSESRDLLFSPVSPESYAPKLNEKF